MSASEVQISSQTPRSFVWCGGGWKRFQPRWSGGAWWWELGGDWGMGILDGVVLDGGRVEIEVDVDLTAPHAGGVSLSWVVDVQTRRLGPDGLPFDQRTEVAVEIDRKALSVSGRCVGEPRRVVLGANESTVAPGRLALAVRDGALCASWRGIERWRGPISPPSAGLLCVGAGADASLESRARWGALVVRAGDPYTT